MAGSVASPTVPAGFVSDASVPREQLNLGVGAGIADNQGITVIASPAVALTTLSGQTATASAATIYTPTQTGWYKVGVYMNTTTAGSAGTATATVSWTDSVHSQSQVVPASGSLALNTANAIQAASVILYSASGSPIQIATTVTANSGGVFSVQLIVERLT